jgi:hypothetical protein
VLGTKHELDLKGGLEPCHIPTVYQLNNYFESTRKRLKYVEGMEGPSKCSRFLQQLQVNNVSKNNVVVNIRAASTCQIDPEETENLDVQTDPTEEDELETEEAILDRQVELDIPG